MCVLIVFLKELISHDHANHSFFYLNVTFKSSLRKCRPCALPIVVLVGTHRPVDADAVNRIGVAAEGISKGRACSGRNSGGAG